MLIKLYKLDKSLLYFMQTHKLLTFDQAVSSLKAEHWHELLQCYCLSRELAAAI